MAVRVPLGIEQPDGQISPQVYQMDNNTMVNIHKFATYAYAQNPSANLEVNTANGTLMSGQPFVDTYYVAGAYSTRVDRYATEAETADIVLTTDNYNRLRLVYDTVSLPTGDTNNLQYPIYLYNTGSGDDIDTHFRAMTRQDFIDTFVEPALSQMDTDGFWDGTNNKEQNGTHFITTSASPTNASLVSSTPVAINSQANPAAYTAGGIPEAVKQTTDVNYYIAQVDHPATAYDVYDSEQSKYDLPLYFDAGTEQIYQHTPTSWANLIGPFLRYYMATSGSGYQVEYNLSSGNQKGSTYVDTRLTNSSTYQTRFVNANDYRSQEFPNGTQTTISANNKSLYIGRSIPSYGASANPSGSVTEGGSITFTLTTTNVLDGTTFAYAITGITAADISSGSLTGNVTISGGSGSTSITLVGFDGTETETATCTFTTPSGTRAASVSVVDLVETVSLEGSIASPEINSSLPLTDGSLQLGWKFNINGDIADYDNDRGITDVTTGHVPWVNTNPNNPSSSYWIRAAIQSQSNPGSQSFAASPSALNTWLALTSVRSFLFTDNRGTNSYGNANVVLKIEIASDSGGSNILATGYYRTSYEGGA